MIWYLPNAFAIFAAGAVNTPTPANAKKMLVRMTNKPIKTRELNKVDEAGFCFMGVCVEGCRNLPYAGQFSLKAEFPR